MNRKHAASKRNTSDDRVNATVPVILIRHAQSQWNLENRFTGWADPPLTEAGIDEALEAAKCLRSHGYRFDAAYSSRLQRAIMTRELVLQALGAKGITRHQDWRLNERHYGALQGLNKDDAISQVGASQVWRWRRGYHDRAAPLRLDQPAHPANDPLYADVDVSRLPSVENLAETRTRVMEFWDQVIVPQIRQRRRLLISAHGNTLRALIMELDAMSVDDIEAFEIPTATPIIYDFDPDGRAVQWRYLDPGCREARTA